MGGKPQRWQPSLCLVPLQPGAGPRRSAWSCREDRPSKAEANISGIWKQERLDDCVTVRTFSRSRPTLFPLSAVHFTAAATQKSWQPCCRLGRWLGGPIAGAFSSARLPSRAHRAQATSSGVQGQRRRMRKKAALPGM